MMELGNNNDWLLGFLVVLVTFLSVVTYKICFTVLSCTVNKLIPSKQNIQGRWKILDIFQILLNFQNPHSRRLYKNSRSTCTNSLCELVKDFVLLQPPPVSPARPYLREVRVGDLHTAGAWGGGRWRLLLRVLQRGHRRLLQASEYTTTTRLLLRNCAFQDQPGCVHPVTFKLKHLLPLLRLKIALL